MLLFADKKPSQTFRTVLGHPDFDPQNPRNNPVMTPWQRYAMPERLSRLSLTGEILVLNCHPLKRLFARTAKLSTRMQTPITTGRRLTLSAGDRTPRNWRYSFGGSSCFNHNGLRTPKLPSGCWRSAARPATRRSNRSNMPLIRLCAI